MFPMFEITVFVFLMKKRDSCSPLVRMVEVMRMTTLETYVLPVMASFTSLMLGIGEFVYMIKIVSLFASDLQHMR